MKVQKIQIKKIVWVAALLIFSNSAFPSDFHVKVENDISQDDIYPTPILYIGNGKGSWSKGKVGEEIEWTADYKEVGVWKPGGTYDSGQISFGNSNNYCEITVSGTWSAIGSWQYTANNPQTGIGCDMTCKNENCSTVELHLYSK